MGEDYGAAADGPVLRQGLLYRESTVVPGIAKRRFGVLLSDRFATRARADDPAAGFGREWKLSPDCVLSPIHTRKLSILGTKQHHSLWALVAGQYEDRELARFSLTAGEQCAALAFDDPAEAGAWHAAFATALAALGGAPARGGSGGSQQGGRLEEGASEDDDGTAPARGPAAATPRHPPSTRLVTPGWRAPGGVRRAAATAAAGVARRVGYVSGGGSHGGAGEGVDLGGGGGAGCAAAAAATAAGSAAPAPLERSASAAALARDFGRTLDACLARAAAAAAVANADGRDAAAAAAAVAAPSPRATGDAAAAAAAGPQSYPLPLPPRPLPVGPSPATAAPLGLTPWYTEDGVTAYCGRDADGDDVLVESFVVRAPPRLCVATLLKGETEGGATAFGGPQAEPPALLAVLDAHTQYLRLRWRPSGWFGAALVAPRELTLKRAWRREDDGQYVVLYTSVEPGEAEAAAGGGGGGGGRGGGGGGGGEPSSSPSFASSWWFAPSDWAAGGGRGGVRGRVLSSGYTFAPLLPEYDPTRASGETLVTHVAKLDAGGLVGALRRSACGPLRALAAPAWSALLHPLAQRSVLLKHRAEAERFVARPFLAGARSGTAGGGTVVVGAAAGGAHAATHPPPPAPEAARVAALATSRSIFRRGGGAAAASATPASPQAPPLTADQGAPPPPQPPPPLSPPAPAAAAAGTMPPSMWSSPGAAGFKVRGPTYLADHRKVEAAGTVFELASVDLVEVDAPAYNVARFLPSIRESASPFTFVVNLMLPGPRPYSVAIAWAADRAFTAPPPPGGGGGGGAEGQAPGGGGGGGQLARFESVVATAQQPPPPGAATAAAAADDEADPDGGPSPPFDLALARFLAGGDSPQADARRDDTFKLIPRVVEGPWVVRQSVGSTPCLLGHKLRQRYWRGPGYLCVDIDVASSSVAATVVGLVLGATRSVVVDLAILLQGNAADELPEALLGTVRLARVDMAAARYLDTKTGVLYEPGVRPAPAGS